MLLRRIAREVDPSIYLDVPPPIRRARATLIQPGELERAVNLAARKARPRGGVLVMFDSDDDCPASLAPRILERAESAAMGTPVYVVLPRREFEAWFLAAAESLRGLRRFPEDLAAPDRPEEVRGAKEWLRNRNERRTYSPAVDQPALAALIDLKQARSAASFDKLYRDIRNFLLRFRD